MENGRLKFFRLVKAMREAQRQYFASRDTTALSKARSLEKQVDAYIKRGDTYIYEQQQKSLFDNEND